MLLQRRDFPRKKVVVFDLDCDRQLPTVAIRLQAQDSSAAADTHLFSQRDLRWHNQRYVHDFIGSQWQVCPHQCTPGTQVEGEPSAGASV